MSLNNSYTKEFATLTLHDGKKLELPIITDHSGQKLVEISPLKQANLFTYDPGLMLTATCESEITYIDGDKGVLLYRGYPIEELAEHSNFLEVCYLLFHGELPSKAGLEEFNDTINNHTLVHEQIHFMFRCFPRDAHPMAILVSIVSALSAFYHEELNVRDPRYREQVAMRLIAKMPTLTAMLFKYRNGHQFITPNNELDYIGNFMNMMFSYDTEPYDINPVFKRALDVLFMLHADHEQNVSTNTVRSAASAGADPFAVMGAGITALWGPAHGGANEAVLNMLHDIGSPDRIPMFIDKAKDKNDAFKLNGFGHRVYKNYDPRAKEIKKVCQDVVRELGKQKHNNENDSLLEIALCLEEIALKDSYFVEKKLYPNVDFYSGIIYHAMGIPTEMFTVMFALARSIGWISQWNEMLSEGELKIVRPRQIYNGATKRRYLHLHERS